MSAQQDSGSDKPVLFLLICVVFAVLYFLLAPKFQELFLTTKMWQMQIITKIVPTDRHQAILYMLENTPSTDWSTAQIRKLSLAVNMYFAPLFVALTVFCGIHIKKYLYLFEKNRDKGYTIDTLMQQEVNSVWRYLKPIVGENLLENTSPDWAKAMKPQEWVIHNDLLNIPDDLMSLNEEKTKKILALQLGKLYTGIEQMPNYIKAIVGCISEHLFGSSLKASFAFMDIADSYGPNEKGKYNYDAGIALFEQHKNNPELLKIMERHAYIYTGVADLFNEAKERGVIISKYFLWLKKTDRKLYYMLNRVGRKVSWIECAGIVDHYQHEMELKRPLAKIFCNAAFAGLKEELKNVKITTRNKELMKRNEETHKKINENVAQLS